MGSRASRSRSSAISRAISREAVREGRRREFAEAYAQHADEMPDPLSTETVRSLPSSTGGGRAPRPRRARLALVRRLLDARRTRRSCRACRSIEPGPRPCGVRRTACSPRAGISAPARRWRMLANLTGERPRFADAHWPKATPIWGGAPPQTSFRRGPSMPRSRRADAARPSRSRPTGCSSARISASTRPRALVPYLKALGVTHLYASPFLKARPGSDARLRHRRSQRRSIRSSAARRPSRACPTR